MPKRAVRCASWNTTESGSRERNTDPKPRPNRAVYVRALRRMTPEQRLAKALDLTEMTRRLLLTGLRERFPHLPEDELRRRYVERLAKCSNRHS